MGKSNIYRLSFILFIFVLLITGACFVTYAQSDSDRTVGQLEVVEKDGVLWAGKGWLQEIEGLKVAYYSGSPLEIGRQHGLLLIDKPEEMKEILLSLDPSHNAEGIIEKTGWFFKNLYARFKFYPDFKRYTRQEHLQEMKGFVQGASRGQENDIYDVMMGTAAQDIALAAPACSAVAAWDEATRDGTMYIGRNLDNPQMTELAQYQYVAFYNPDTGQQFVVHNYPSYTGTMTGMNESGIMISSNYSLASDEQITINGLPYMLMLREVLQYATSMDEALEIIKKSPRTIGLNLMLASSEENKAVVVELTAHHFQVRDTDNKYIFTSNMFRHPRMKEFQAPGWLSSALRDRRFEELGEQYYGVIDENIIRDFMRDKFDPDSSAGQGFYSGINSLSNIASMVFAPGREKLWVGLISDKSFAPFAADGKFVEIDAGQVWQEGKPLSSYNILPATEWKGYSQDWLKVREAEALVQQKSDKKALVILEDILAEHPEAAFPQFLAGRVNNRLGNYEKGLSYLQMFIAQEVHVESYRLLQARFWSGLINDIQGNRSRAVEHYQKALTVKVEDMSGETNNFREWARKGITSPLTVNKQGQVIQK